MAKVMLVDVRVQPDGEHSLIGAAVYVTEPRNEGTFMRLIVSQTAHGVGPEHTEAGT